MQELQKMEQLSVKGVIIDQISDMPSIILKTADGKKAVSIGVGPAEAIAIIMALDGMRASRPLTHDLFVHFFLMHRFKVEKVEIYRMIGAKYYAKLYYRKGLIHHQLEVRPSDALALAVRLRTPIFVNQGIIEKQTGLGRLDEDGTYFKGDESLFEYKN